MILQSQILKELRSTLKSGSGKIRWALSDITDNTTALSRDGARNKELTEIMHHLKGCADRLARLAKSVQTNPPDVGWMTYRPPSELFKRFFSEVDEAKE